MSDEYDDRRKVDRASFRLDEQSIHVWSLPIRQSESIISWCRDLLSPDERIRAERFSFDYLQRSFIFTRGALRVLLGRYLAISPKEVSFRYSAAGKPSVAIETSLRFNTSHSGGIVLYAFARECDIGVDVEQIRDMPETDDLVRSFFNSQEASQLASIPRTERQAAFFRCWTRKEAYLKATGSGLSTSLDSFCVTLIASEPARLVHIGGDRQAAQAWNLQDLALSPQHAAAVAYRGTSRLIRLVSQQEIADLRNLI